MRPVVATCGGRVACSRWVAEAALSLDDDKLVEVQRLAAWDHAHDPEPATGPKLNNGRIMARRD